MLLEDKAAVIYGAGGLGAGVARTFAREGRGSSSRAARASRSRRSPPTSPPRAGRPTRPSSTRS
jgi:NAD(P)-dependent dehydrogenase (short-subunit alcohol dehydrogenase family)